MENCAVTKGRVCVTGATGFLASWLVKQLLDSGYHVVGTIRDTGSGNSRKLAHLWDLEGSKERLHIMRADLMEEGSFDNAIFGCEGVFHTASPVVGEESDPKREMLDPAIDGTLNVLRSCKRNPHLRRVVLTSSSAATRVRADINPEVPLDETSWSSIDICRSLKLWYAMAKVLAEKEAWEFARENMIDLVTILPSFIIGPCLPYDLCHTASKVAGLLRGETERFAIHGRMGYVHIDDVARCHILAYEDARAHGRYLCSSIVVEFHELVDILNRRYPALNIPKKIDDCFGEMPYYDFNTSKLKELQFEFRSIEEMFDDCIRSLTQQGHLNYILN